MLVRIILLTMIVITSVASATVTSPTSGQAFCVGDTVTWNSDTGKASARLPDGQCVNYGTWLSPLPISGTASSIGDRTGYDAHNCTGNSITYRVVECPVLTVDKSTVAAGETITASGMASGAVSVTFFPESVGGLVVTSTLYADPYTKKFSTSASTSGLSAGTYSIKATSGGKTLSVPVTVYQVVVGGLARVAIGLSASNTNPELNENVTLTATINNVGQQMATGVAVRFSVNGVEKTECAKTVDIQGSNYATATCVATFATAATVTAKVEATCSMCETGYKAAYKTVSINAGAPVATTAVATTAAATTAAATTAAATVVVGQLARISTAELSASNTAPEVNENVIMTATISNIGQQKATGVAVRFSVDGEEMTGCTATGNIGAGNSATSTCFMSFHAAGTYTVKVEATCTMCETGYKTASKTIAITASATTPATTTTPTPILTTTPTPVPTQTTPAPTTLSYPYCNKESDCKQDEICNFAKFRCESSVTPTAKTIAETPTSVTTTRQPAFEAIFAIAGLLAVAYLIRRRR
jgi:hypothetical protein